MLWNFKHPQKGPQKLNSITLERHVRDFQTTRTTAGSSSWFHANIYSRISSIYSDVVSITYTGKQVIVAQANDQRLQFYEPLYWPGNCYNFTEQYFITNPLDYFVRIIHHVELLSINVFYVTHCKRRTGRPHVAGDEEGVRMWQATRRASACDRRKDLGETPLRPAKFFWPLNLYWFSGPRDRKMVSILTMKAFMSNTCAPYLLKYLRELPDLDKPCWTTGHNDMLWHSQMISNKGFTSNTRARTSSRSTITAYSNMSNTRYVSVTSSTCFVLCHMQHQLRTLPCPARVSPLPRPAGASYSATSSRTWTIWVVSH